MKILVIDDSEIVLGLVKSQLGSHGHAVSGALTLDELVPLLEKKDWDLVLIDVHMPELFGYDLIGYLRAVVKIRAPIALLSSLDDGRLTAYAEQYRADGFIRKDPGLASLAREVLRLTSRGG